MVLVTTRSIDCPLETIAKTSSVDKCEHLKSLTLKFVLVIRLDCSPRLSRGFKSLIKKSIGYLKQELRLIQLIKVDLSKLGCLLNFEF